MGKSESGNEEGGELIQNAVRIAGLAAAEQSYFLLLSVPGEIDLRLHLVARTSPTSELLSPNLGIAERLFSSGTESVFVIDASFDIGTVHSSHEPSVFRLA